MGIAARSSDMQRRAYLWREDGTRLITHQQTATLAVKQIVDMMGKLMRSRAPLFEVVRDGGRSYTKCTALGTNFLMCVNADLGRVSEFFSAHRHSPYYILFKRFAAPLSLLCTGKRLYSQDVDRVNAAIEKMRAFGKGDALGRAMRNLKRCEQENNRSTRKLLANLRDGYSKTLVLRLDLGYYSSTLEAGHISALDISLKDAQQHRNKLLTYLRKGPLSKHLSGYVWRLEYGLQKGHHYHLAIFYDGQKLAKDIRIADIIGSYWHHNVTEGKGMFFSCNKNKEEYERCGIGMVDRTDSDKWHAVQEAVGYLSKQDMYLRFRPGPRIRTFGVGGPY